MPARFTRCDHQPDAIRAHICQCHRQKGFCSLAPHLFGQRLSRPENRLATASSLTVVETPGSALRNRRLPSVPARPRAGGVELISPNESLARGGRSADEPLGHFPRAFRRPMQRGRNRQQGIARRCAPPLSAASRARPKVTPGCVLWSTQKEGTTLDYIAHVSRGSDNVATHTVEAAATRRPSIWR